MKKLLIVPIIFLLSLVLVQAQQLKITYVIEPEEGISLGETAVFTVTIENRAVSPRTLFIEPIQQYGKWRVETPDPYILDLGAGKLATTIIRITPLAKIKVGTYNQKIIIKSEDERVYQEVILPVKIIPFENAIDTQIIMPNVVDPREGIVVKVMMENLYNYDFQNLDLKVYSDLFEKTTKIDLMSDDKKIKEFQFSFQPSAIPGNYLVTAEVKNKEAIIGRDTKVFTLTEYSDISEKTIKEEGLLSSAITVVKTNEGNTRAVGKIVFRLTPFQKLFSSFNKEPTSVTKDKAEYVYEWDFVLEAQEEYSVTVTTNYIILFLTIIILIVFIALAYRILSRKITITKRVMQISKTKDGISGMKILLHVKNKSGFTFKKLRIIDYLPKLVAPSKDFGTIKPTNVQRSPSGSIRVIWDINRLERGEERIISYKIRSKLSIIGRFSLPSAVVEYRNKRGRLIRIHSNKLTLLIPEEKEE